MEVKANGKQREFYMNENAIVLTDRVSFSETGLDLPADLTEDEHCDVGRKLARVNHAIQFAIGDWANAHRWGELELACKKVGLDYGSARTFKSVATAFPLSTRIDKLTFGHYRAVHPMLGSPFEDELPGLLERAENECLSTRQLGKARKEIMRPDGVGAPAEPKPGSRDWLEGEVSRLERELHDALHAAPVELVQAAVETVEQETWEEWHETLREEIVGDANMACMFIAIAVQEAYPELDEDGREEVAGIGNAIADLTGTTVAVEPAEPTSADADELARLSNQIAIMRDYSASQAAEISALRAQLREATMNAPPAAPEAAVEDPVEATPTDDTPEVEDAPATAEQVELDADVDRLIGDMTNFSMTKGFDDLMKAKEARQELNRALGTKFTAGDWMDWAQRGYGIERTNRTVVMTRRQWATLGAGMSEAGGIWSLNESGLEELATS